MSQPDQSKVLTISRLTQMLQWTLRDKFRDVWVGGEISNLTKAASGHVYLTLADETAQVKAVIWRTDAERIKFDLENGMQVICNGAIDIYPPRGTYQLTIQKIEPKGVGAQQLALKKLHRQLAAEGLFDPNRKKPLPPLPRRIAVVTSPTGAAIQDFLQVVARRWADVEVLIIPARVQGEGAALEIAQGVVVAGLLINKPDVIVVTRGGGSAEDLYSFNDERVVRAIAACEIPVVSAVGHEIDVTLADLVADRRALTPSEAGELVVPVREAVDYRIEELEGRMNGALRKQVDIARERLNQLQKRRVLTDPQHLLNTARRQVDDLEFRLTKSKRYSVERSEGRLAVLAARLEGISPLKVLARGYSITQDSKGATIADAKQLNVGDQLVTRLNQGIVESEVKRIRQ